MECFRESQLIINPDGTIYHLKLRPEHIANTVILVGDPGRVEKISSHFSKIEIKVSNREMITHTGYFGGKRLSVISTGIGPDNIDIVVNELDALANIDLQKRIIRSNLKSLNLIRIGTSGTIQPDIPVDTFGITDYAMGMDNIPDYYDGMHALFENKITEEFIQQTSWPDELARPYVIKADGVLKEKIGEDMISGITLTAPGFYAAQGRTLRIGCKYPDLNDRIMQFKMNDLRVINFEMESSALYALGKKLGHHVVTVCAIIANRANEIYSSNPQKPVDELVSIVLERLTV